MAGAKYVSLCCASSLPLSSFLCPAAQTVNVPLIVPVSDDVPGKETLIMMYELNVITSYCYCSLHKKLISYMVLNYCYICIPIRGVSLKSNSGDMLPQPCA